MELFLSDLREGQSNGSSSSLYDQLLDRICARKPDVLPAESALDWLIERTGCALAEPDAQQMLHVLRGRHVHIWQDEDQYSILVVGRDPAVEQALQALVKLEDHCAVHPVPQLAPHEEGYFFIAQGENAFIYAQLFLGLEQASDDI